MRVEEVLQAAVRGIDGHERPGQLEMAQAVAAALDSGEHLLVQAGTGTGKSLGYLAPVLLRLTQRPRERVVIATATLALQSQLAAKDIPAALEAVEEVTGKRPRYAVLKGRTNYACLHRVRDGTADDQGTLLSAADLVATARTSATTPESALGAEVVALRAWAEEQLSEGGLADRDDAPSHTDRGWNQISIPVRECLGVQRCPQGGDCFVEKSREEARAADLVITNHALLAIDAMHGGTALPEHGAVIIDEAHELTSRVTGAASAELSPQIVERVGRRAQPHLDDELALDLLESADTLRTALDDAALERIEDPDAAPIAACQEIRAVTRRAVTALNADATPERRQVAAAVKEIFDVAERICGLAALDVVWVSERERAGRELRVAPLSVAGLMRSRVFGETTTVLTSATLRIGGDFDGIAGSVGLRAAERSDRIDDAHRHLARAQQEDARDEVVDTDTFGVLDDETSDLSVDEAEQSAGGGSSGGGSRTVSRRDEDRPAVWSALDVGSPFDYRRQGILYVARSLPPPGRDKMSEECLTEIAELVWAAGGRTLGLFSSRRAAETAAVWVRRQLPKLTVLCQGDAQLPELTRRFVAEPTTSLFGTLSLWQGVDVPGETCQLVIIDRIPFPRPDEPLTVARQRAVAEAGGNGFMTVAAGHAALLLAQGAGRLIRRVSDRGVVAVLDPRLVTARYGSFLRASMPSMWETSDREVAVQALRRLDATTPA